MTVTEAVAKAKELFGIEPSAAYKGIETADDFVFAIQTDTTKQAAEGTWIVCADHVKEHSGALNASTSDNNYIRSGTTTTKGAPSPSTVTAVWETSFRTSCSPIRSLSAVASLSLCRTFTSLCALARARRVAAY